MRGSGVEAREAKERLRRRNEGKNKKNEKGFEEEVGKKDEGIAFFAKISRLSDRFIISLPKTFNPTWEKLWKSKKRVKIAVVT